MTGDEHVLELVDDYLHEVLDPNEAERVEQHCETCRICQVALEEARQRFDLLQAMPRREAPDELIAKTLQGIDMQTKRGSWKWKFVKRGIFVAAAAAVLIAVSNLYYAQLSPSNFDLQVFGQQELLAGTQASLRVNLFERGRGVQGVADVPVEISLVGTNSEHFVKLASFNTDVDGTSNARFELPEWPEGQYELKIVAHTDAGDEVLTQPIQLSRSWKLMLSTDKPLYQPGQTIRLRSLALRRPDLKPVAGEKVTFSISDPKGNVIFKQRDVTSRFGISSADCPLATEINEGEYRIDCRVGDTTSSQTVKVFHYVLPKFKVDLSVDRAYYEPAGMVKGTVAAGYFFGQPVAGGKVKLTAKSIDVGPDVLFETELPTDAAGKANFEFRLPDSMVGRPQRGGDAELIVTAEVTDTAGQQQSRTLQRVVTAQVLRVEVIPESGTLVSGVANRVYIVATYADGRPAAGAHVSVSGFDEQAASPLGLAVVEITPKTPEVGITVKATDSDGHIGRKHVTFTCGTAGGDFLVRSDKAVYDGGQTVHLTALGGGVEPVFVDLVKDGQTVLTETIEMTDGRGAFRFDLPPDVFGTLEMCAYRFGRDGLAVRKKRVLYVRQAGQLAINTKLDAAEYRPGGTAKLTFTLTDPAGKPVPGALSLAAVDEAVYSVLAQRPGLEQTFFTLEEELLKPVYTIYGWDPWQPQPPANFNEMEDAIFASTADTIDEPFDLGISGNDGAWLTAASNWPHTLTLTSFPVKAAAVRAAKRNGLAAVQVAWWSLIGTMALGMIVLVAISYPKPFLFTSGGVLIGMCLLGMVLMMTIGDRLEPTNAVLFEAAGGMDFAAADLAMPMEEAKFEPTEPTAAPPTGEDAPAKPRVRQHFPETLLWRPELVTDEQGHATLELPLADSITSWRLAASAVSADGRLGATQTPIKVFQPFFVDFNLPVALTRGDEVELPVVVYNYLDAEQTVSLNLEPGDWFELLDGNRLQSIKLAPGEAKSASYRIRVAQVGTQQLQVSATSGTVADAVLREVRVIPDGRRVEHVASGVLRGPVTVPLDVPADAIDGSAKAIVTLYPSSFSQLVEGLDKIFQQPYGCFEQTSSTTYPNVLALDYLRSNKKSLPEVEAKARQYIHLGYQRLVGFEVDGGGFDWFGNPPSNRTLTAYGLMEFEDMARVHDVDPNLIARTRRWLLAQRKADGSWDPESHEMHDEPTRGGSDALARLSTTAYIGWAVFGHGQAAGQAQPTLDFLLAHRPGEIDSSYALALVINAVATISPNAPELPQYLARLDSLKKTSEDGKQVWWEQPENARTTFYGSGAAGNVVTTAMATLALLQSNSQVGNIRGALGWIAAQKDANGLWPSTQATVLSLKALLAGSGKPLGEEVERKFTLAVGDRQQSIVIPADQGDVVRQLEIPAGEVADSPRITLTEQGETEPAYQITFWYHVPYDEGPRTELEPLTVELVYDRDELRVSDTVTATAAVTNNTRETAPMVVLDLPIPGGFAVDRSDFDKLVTAGMIAKYQVSARQVIVYLRGLDSGDDLVLKYRLKATMPVRLSVPPAQAWQYYDPGRRGSSRAAKLTVTKT